MTEKFKSIYEKEIKGIIADINKMPNTTNMSLMARSLYFKYNNENDLINNPDKVLQEWIDIEYMLFKAIESKLVSKSFLKEIRDVKNIDDINVDKLMEISMSALNRRKSRAGKSLENQIEAIFRFYEIPFSSQCITENKKKPDFIFSSIFSYHNEADKTDLICLGCKRTLKDRWVQVLTEAKKIPTKHILTIQDDISREQLDTMKKDNVIVVSPYANNYKDIDNIISVKDFLNLLIDKYKKDLV